MTFHDYLTNSSEISQVVIAVAAIMGITYTSRDRIINRNRALLVEAKPVYSKITEDMFAQIILLKVLIRRRYFKMMHPVTKAELGLEDELKVDYPRIIFTNIAIFDISTKYQLEAVGSHELVNIFNDFITTSIKIIENLDKPPLRSEEGTVYANHLRQTIELEKLHEAFKKKSLKRLKSNFFMKK